MNVKRFVFSAVTIIFSFILQSCVFTRLSFGGIIPNLLIIITASFGFMRGEGSGITIGFISGLLCDIFSGSVLGFYALLYMCIGYVNGKFARIFYPMELRLPLLAILGSDFTYGMVCYILLFLLRGRFAIGYYFLHIIVPEMVYTILVTIVYYPLILLINTRLEKDEQRSAKKFV
ncbi:MAG: rod shape-determining protein MreD [Lachnospiraceae bacterium]|nr:rod shape-determining protein MreD [Lachnospiraceae bacterium]